MRAWTDSLIARTTTCHFRSISLCDISIWSCYFGQGIYFLGVNLVLRIPTDTIVTMSIHSLGPGIHYCDVKLVLSILTNALVASFSMLFISNCKMWSKKHNLGHWIHVWNAKFVLTFWPTGWSSASNMLEISNRIVMCNLNKLNLKN